MLQRFFHAAQLMGHWLKNACFPFDFNERDALCRVPRRHNTCVNVASPGLLAPHSRGVFPGSAFPTVAVGVGCGGLHCEARASRAAERGARSRGGAFPRRRLGAPCKLWGPTRSAYSAYVKRRPWILSPHVHQVPYR